MRYLWLLQTSLTLRSWRCAIILGPFRESFVDAADCCAPDFSRLEARSFSHHQVISSILGCISIFLLRAGQGDLTGFFHSAAQVVATGNSLPNVVRVDQPGKW